MKHLTVNTILAAALGLCTIPSHATAQQAPKVQKTEKGLAYKRGGRIDFEVPNSHNGGERLEDVLKTLAGHFRSKTVNFIFSSKGIAGVRVPAMQLKGQTPLDYNSRHSGTKNIQDFLRNNGGLTGKELIDASMLREAVRNGDLQKVKQAMANSLDINATDGDNNTALDLASKNKEIADLLRKHGAKTGEESKAEGK